MKRIFVLLLSGLIFLQGLVSLAQEDTVQEQVTQPQLQPTSIETSFSTTLITCPAGTVVGPALDHECTLSVTSAIYTPSRTPSVVEAIRRIIIPPSPPTVDGNFCKFPCNCTYSISPTKRCTGTTESGQTITAPVPPPRYCGFQPGGAASREC